MLPINGRGAWVWYASQCGTVEDMIFWARQGKIDHLLVKVGDGNRFGTADEPFVFSDQFENVRDGLKAAGIRVLTWSYNYLNDPQGEADIAIWALNNGSDGHVFDIESESEGKADAADMLGALVRSKHPDAFLAYAPHAVIDYHLKLPYLQFNAFCDAVMPQFYTLELGNGREWSFPRLFAEWDRWIGLWQASGNTVPVLVPFIDGYKDGNTATIAEYGPIATARGIEGVSIWRFDTMQPAMYEALAAIPFTDPALPAPVPQPVPATIGDPLRWWRCPKGHEWESRGNFMVSFTIDGIERAKTGRLCPRCLAVNLDAIAGGVMTILPNVPTPAP